MSEYLAKIERDGYVIVEDVIDEAQRASLSAELSAIDAAATVVRRTSRGAGLRDLMNVVPATRALADAQGLRALVEPVLGTSARVVRGILFDKTADANWKVAWHQDVTIAVRERRDAEGFGAWSVKAGVTHVQPPAAVLERMLTLRVHLDTADETNGALQVLAGSHADGRLSAEQIDERRTRCAPTLCRVGRGGVLAMRPLLLHASSRAALPCRRRVLHFEYAAAELPEGLEWYES